MVNKLKYTITTLLCVLHLTATAQNTIQITRILGSALESSKAGFYKEKISQFNDLDYDIPLLEKIEVRSETNDFDIAQQDMTVRVTTNSKSSRKAYKQYHESVQHMSQMEYQAEIIDALAYRYNLIVDYIYAHEKLELEKSRFALAQDKVKLLKRMVSLASFDIVELIDAEDEVNQTQRLILDTEINIDNLRDRLLDLVNLKVIDISTEDILSVEDIRSFLLTLEPPTGNHPLAEIQSARHYNALMEHEWEAANSKFSLGFIQASYGHNADRGFRSNFSLGVGFDIPVKGSSRLDLNEKKINILDTQSEYIATKEALAQAKLESTTRLKRLLSMYDLLNQQIEEGNAAHALQEYSRQSTASPLAIIKLKELNMNTAVLLLEVEEDITNSYLSYLYSTGLLGEAPYKNYLDPGHSLLPLSNSNF